MFSFNFKVYSSKIQHKQSRLKTARHSPFNIKSTGGTIYEIYYLVQCCLCRYTRGIYPLYKNFPGVPYSVGRDINDGSTQMQSFLSTWLHPCKKSRSSSRNFLDLGQALFLFVTRVLVMDDRRRRSDLFAVDLKISGVSLVPFMNQKSDNGKQ